MAGPQATNRGEKKTYLFACRVSPRHVESWFYDADNIEEQAAAKIKKERKNISFEKEPTTW